MKRTSLRVAVAVTAALLISLLAGCNSAIGTEKLIKRSWLPDTGTGRETFVYAVKKDGVPAGTLTLSVTDTEKGYRIERSQTMLNGDSVTGRVDFDRSSRPFPFPPRESVCARNIGGKVSAYRIRYGNGKALYSSAEGAEVPGNAPEKSFGIKSPFYDNMQFYTILRGAEFGKKFNLTFNVFIPAEGTTAAVSCVMSGNRTVSYRIDGKDGQTDCQALTISRVQSVPGEPITAFYATRDLTAGDRKLRQALVSFTESGYEYTLTDASAE